MTLHDREKNLTEIVAGNTGLPAKVDVVAQVLSQTRLSADVCKLVLQAPSIALRSQPGQFVQVGLPQGGTLLRRPLGLAEVDTRQGNISLIYRIVGKGTDALSNLRDGAVVKVLGPLGHGFSRETRKPLLVGGGMGLSPLLYYAQWLSAHNIKVDVLMGGRTAEELFWQRLFATCTDNIYLTTDDGSLGLKGLVTDLLPQILTKSDYDKVMVCGPEIMMKNVYKVCREKIVPCEVSLERRMGCGLGACLSCPIDTLSGRRKVCKDGPVFPAEEVFF